MKKSKELIGAPVISISEGMQIGTVKGLIVNPQQKNVEFLLLDEPDTGKDLKGLSFLSAEGIGEYAVTVQDKNVLVDIYKIGILKELVQKDIQVLGTKIVTKKGKYLGDVVEFSIDTTSGELAEVFYKGLGEEEQSLKASSIITIGKEVLIVEEEAATLRAGDSFSIKNEAGNFKEGDDRSAGTVATPVPETIKSDFAARSSAAERDMLVSEQKGDLDPAEIFVQRQRQYLIGKTLLKDLKADDGEVLAWENQVITEEIFNRIYRLGAQKLMELAMSVRE